jgi:acetyl-CoA acetyltransferase
MPAWIGGVGDTPFGRAEGKDSLDLMAEAATLALGEAGCVRGEIDGLVTGYSTALPHLMLANLFAEHFGLRPAYAHTIQLGGATGSALVMLAKSLVETGRCRTVLVVAGENRLSNPGGRDMAISTLAQVGHAFHEVPYGATIPGYYALLASQYMAAYGIEEADLAEMAVLMRRHAARHPKAHLPEPVTVEDVLASRPIASPLKLLDCCPISDGAIAVLVTAERDRSSGVRLLGSGQAHQHQHLSQARDLADFGARLAAERAFAEAGIGAERVGVLGIYDSFTITLTILLEELGFCGRGDAAGDVRAGRFAFDGPLPMNTHGGLLAFGHPGVAGGMAHLVEVVRQMTGRAEARQMGKLPEFGFVHGDGGILSAHVSLVLGRE